MSISIIGMIIALVALAIVLWNGHRTRAMLREARVLRDQGRRDL